jgi:hypothetical protein
MNNIYIFFNEKSNHKKMYDNFFKKNKTNDQMCNKNINDSNNLNTEGVALVCSGNNKVQGVKMRD